MAPPSPLAAVEFLKNSLAACSRKWNTGSVIVSFADKQTAALWNDQRTRFPADLEDRAANKLAMLHAAASLAVLRVPLTP